MKDHLSEQMLYNAKHSMAITNRDICRAAQLCLDENRQSTVAGLEDLIEAAEIHGFILGYEAGMEAAEDARK